MNEPESKINNNLNLYLIKAAEDYFNVSSTKIWNALKTPINQTKLIKKAKKKNQQQKYLNHIIILKKVLI